MWPNPIKKSLMENFIFCAVEFVLCEIQSLDYCAHVFKVNNKDTRR